MLQHMKYCIALILCLFAPLAASAQATEPAVSEYVKAKVISVTEPQTEEFAGLIREQQDVELQLLSGENAGDTVTIDHGLLPHRKDLELSVGQMLVVQQLTMPDGEVVYLFREAYRLHTLWILIGFFFLLGIGIGGKRGFTSILGLTASVLILVFFVVPNILSGNNPLFICLIGCAGIACSSLFLAHGFNKRTLVAFYSTIITLAFSTLMAITFVYVARLFGMGTEESMFLQTGNLGVIDMRGLLLGGIIIGALGVLDDITTAQTAAVDELSKANHNLGAKELYKAGASIGKEHVAALINTLALAYIGASLPTFLLFTLNTETPWWIIMNSEFVAEEIIRTLVGSSTLLLSVPISTWLAAHSFKNGNHTNVEGCGHVH